MTSCGMVKGVMMSEAGREADYVLQLSLHTEYRGGGPNHRKAYELLAASFSDMVWRLANRFAAKYGAEAEDLYQDGFKNGVMRALESFDSARHCKISSYVYKAVERAVIRSAKRYNKQQRRTVQVSVDDEGELALLPLYDTGPEHREMATKLQEVITRALSRLSRVERRVMTLKYGLRRGRRKMTDREIAEKMDRDRSRVSQIAEKARQKLLADLEVRRVASDIGFPLIPVPKKGGKSCRLMVAVNIR